MIQWSSPFIQCMREVHQKSTTVSPSCWSKCIEDFKTAGSFRYICSGSLHLLEVPAKHKSFLFLALLSVGALFVQFNTLIGLFVSAALETQYPLSDDMWPWQRGRQIQ